MTLYCSVNDMLRVCGQHFNEPVLVIGQPLYGRVLLREHGLDVDDCAFTGSPAALTLRDVRGAVIANCVFMGSEDGLVA